MDFRNKRVAFGMAIGTAIEASLLVCGFGYALIIVSAYFIGIAMGGLHRCVKSGEFRALYAQAGIGGAKFISCFTIGFVGQIASNIGYVMMDVARLAGAWLLLKLAFAILDGSAYMACLA